jgi:hypothetical protein
MDLTEDDVDDMEEILNEMKRGTLIDILPRQIDGNVAIGLSVAVDSLREGEYEIAIRSLEVTVEKLKEERRDDE